MVLPTLSPQQIVLYQKLRLLLWIGMVSGGVLFSLSVLFPRIVHFLDLNEPSSLKLADLEFSSGANPDFTINGKIAPTSTVTAFASHLGDFSSIDFRITLEHDSSLPESITTTLRRANRAAFLPRGEPITASPNPTIYQISNTYYLLQDNTLIPFISEAAYQSRYPEGHTIAKADTAIFNIYTKGENPIGFRIGSLLSFADGVYIITSETEMRPVGSAEIFLALGYRFEDVKAVSEEELGIYKRGRIILLNTPYSEGTLFEDTSSNTVFIIDQGHLRAVLDPTYLKFLLGEQTPITIHAEDATEYIDCDLQKNLFPRSYSCTATIDSFKDNLGYSYEFVFGQDTNQPIEIKTMRVIFDTHVTLENAHRLLAKIKQRLLERFGLASSN